MTSESECESKRGRSCVDTSGFETQRPAIPGCVKAIEFIGIDPGVFDVPTKSRAGDLGRFCPKEIVDSIFRIMMLPEGELERYIELIAERSVGLDALWEPNPDRIINEGLPCGVLQRLRTIKTKNGHHIVCPGFADIPRDGPMTALKKRLANNIRNSCGHVRQSHVMMPIQTYRQLPETALPKLTREVTDDLDKVKVDTCQLIDVVLRAVENNLDDINPKQKYVGSELYGYDMPTPISHRAKQLVIDD